MKGIERVGAIRNIAIATTLTVGLAGCLSKEESSAGFVPDHANDVVIAGSVGDGPAVNANLRITSKDGDLLAQLKSDAKGAYVVTVQARDGQYPLLVDASGGTDLVTGRTPDFVMRSAVLSTGANATANVNPFSTLAFELAKDLNGGISKDNLKKAQRIVVDSMNNGLTSVTQPGPMGVNVDANNVSEIVRSSESLAEIVRRTRNALRAAGHTTTGDDVMGELGSDLIDGVVEGNGGPRANERTAAVATIVAAQVQLESMANALHVNGRNATAAMRAAIEQVSPGMPQPSIDELTVTNEMILLAHIGLAAAQVVSDSAAVDQLAIAISSIQPGMDASLVTSLLPAGYRDALGDAVTMAASGDASVVDAINSVSRSGPPGAPPPQNRAPTISGNPDNSVTAGDRYEFTPTASDLDGDDLSFTIEGKPGWASFDASTGRLAGTPAAAGTHEGITITVSDGRASSSVGPFSIRVNAAGPVTVSVTLDWSAPSENEDGSALTDLAGYKIYWGTTQGFYPNSVKIDSPGLTRYVVDNLEPGTYRFVATAINSAGMESAFSNEILKTAQ